MWILWMKKKTIKGQFQTIFWMIKKFTGNHTSQWNAQNSTLDWDSAMSKVAKLLSQKALKCVTLINNSNLQSINF
jgi:predicted transcriptional regulator